MIVIQVVYLPYLQTVLSYQNKNIIIQPVHHQGILPFSQKHQQKSMELNISQISHLMHGTPF